MNPVIEIVIVGDEILSGRTRDTNAVFMIDTLGDEGYSVSHVSIVGDNYADIADVFGSAVRRSDIVLVTGGLGPTSDDRTVEALARTFGMELVENVEVLDHIQALFARRGWYMSESNRKQALVPRGAGALDNPNGTAPGIRAVLPGGTVGSNAVFYLMPGVPREMRAMFADTVLPGIKKVFAPRGCETVSVHVTGIGESTLYDRIKDIPGAEGAFAFYPYYTGIEVKIRTEADADVPASVLRDKIIGRLGDNVFSTGATFEETLAGMLIERGLTIAVAESCTGGLVSDRLTDVPGSSAYMLLGVVAYANEAKISVLGVDGILVARHGAVSAEVAGAMAEGIKHISGADIGISTTGIAGPSGATPEKPLGLMYAGLCSPRGTVTKKLQFGVERIINKKRMSQAVLDFVRRMILKNEL